MRLLQSHLEIIFIFQVIHQVCTSTFPHPQISGTSQREARPAWPARPGRRPVAAWLVKGRGRPESSWGCGTPRGNGWKPKKLVLWVDGSPFSTIFSGELQKPLGLTLGGFSRVSGIFLNKEPAEGWFQKVFFFVKGMQSWDSFFGQVVLETKENTFSFNMILKGSRLYFLMQIDSIHPSHQHEPPKSRFFLILPWQPPRSCIYFRLWDDGKNSQVIHIWK